jgi:hypothetical protein
VLTFPYVVVDKNLIDTTMTVLWEWLWFDAPSSRLITISLHKEIKVLPFWCGNPVCSFVVSLCTLASMRRDDMFHSSLCIFDKLDGRTQRLLFPLYILLNSLMCLDLPSIVGKVWVARFKGHMMSLLINFSRPLTMHWKFSSISFYSN